MEINRLAPVQMEHEAFIKADPRKVWQVLTDINNWPKWLPEVTNAQLNGALEKGASFKWKSGAASINSTLHTLDPIKQIGWTGRAFGIHAIHNWTLKENDGGTLLRSEESMQGALALILKGMVNKTLIRATHNWFNRLKIAVEGQ